MTSREIAWLAGLLEGEGCFSLTKGSVTVQVTMTDRDIVERSAWLVGAPSVGTHATSHTKRGHQVCYRWTLCGSSAAAWMMTIYPFMGERRRATIRARLARWKQTGFYRREITCGHPDAEHNAHGMCKRC